MAEFTDWILRSECIKTVFELKINHMLSKNEGFLSAKDICGYVKSETEKSINSSYLQRVMRYLARFGVFEEKYDGEVIVFAASNELKNIDNYSMYRVDIYRDLAIHLMSALDGTKKDKPLVEHVTGMPPFTWVEATPERLQYFKGTMDLVSKDVIPYIPKIANEIKKECKDGAKVLDLGGGSGQMLQLLKSELPNFKYANFDLPQVIAALKEIPDVELVPGNFFDVTTMPKCDVVFTKNILHDWADTDCIKLMTNAHRVLSDGGLFLSVNYDLPEPGDKKELSSFVRALDLEMLMICNSKERTLTEYKEVHKKAGFEVKRKVELGPESRPCSLFIATKLKQ